MDKKLSTIQKIEKLNAVYAVGEVGPGGGYHRYRIVSAENGKEPAVLADIQFQRGPRGINSSEDGVLDADLLEIIRDRLKLFQEGEFETLYNDKALEHVEEALMWLNRRVEDRAERNVLGTYHK
jgi:hypothetical protein